MRREGGLQENVKRNQVKWWKGPEVLENIVTALGNAQTGVDEDMVEDQ